MQIRELEAKTGLERATIRYYEREGFIQPNRHENGYREYSPEDCETLLKIKLLRKLGISLERIQDLQQGREDFLNALAEQINELEGQIQAAERAKNVCEQMRCDGVSYGTLNAEYYLKILEDPMYGVKTVSVAPVPEFQAKRYLKRHPVRRYIARSLDLSVLTAAVSFLVFVVLRVRLEVELLKTIISILCVFLSVPINALLISRFGTTPGKWVMGMRVLSSNGNLLSFEEAKDREWGALRSGCGFYLPIISLVRLIKSYREYIESYDNSWYRDSEILYDRWAKTRRILAAVALIICTITSAFTEFYKQKPIYLGKNITISQFSYNYNYTYKRLFKETGEILSTTGKFQKYYYPVYDGQETRPEFEFELEGESVKAIRYETEYLYVFSNRQLPPQCIAAAVSMASAQRNVNVFELMRFTNEVVNALHEFESNGTDRSGEIVVENVVVTWSETMDITESLMNAKYNFEVRLTD